MSLLFHRLTVYDGRFTKTLHNARLVRIMSRRSNRVACVVYTNFSFAKKTYVLIDFDNNCRYALSLSRRGFSNRFPGQDQERIARVSTTTVCITRTSLHPVINTSLVAATENESDRNRGKTRSQPEVNSLSMGGVLIKHDN